MQVCGEGKAQQQAGREKTVDQRFHGMSRVEERAGFFWQGVGGSGGHRLMWLTGSLQSL